VFTSNTVPPWFTKSSGYFPTKNRPGVGYTLASFGCFAYGNTAFLLLRAYPVTITSLWFIVQLWRVFRFRKFGKSFITRLLSGVTFLPLLKSPSTLFYSLVNHFISYIVIGVKEGYNKICMYDQMYLERQRRKYFGTPTARIKFWSKLAYGGFIALIGGLLCVGLLFAWYAKDLPRPDKVQRSTGLSTVIQDRNGQRLYDIFEEADRIPANWEEIPQYLKDATVAVEDKDFYKHQGLSTTGILRGMLACVLLRRCQGGSTLTQQLVKNVLLTQERTLPRKMKEAVLAIQIERKYSKNDILLMYLNEAPYGGTAAGVKAASQNYFNKDVKDLNLVESAVIAGLPQSPSYYSPFTGDAKAYVTRATHVLRRMREDGYITPVQEADAKGKLDSLAFAAGSEALRAPHFVAYVKDLLIKRFGEKAVEAGGMKVTTTLDWNLQEKAQAAVKEEVDKAKNLKVSNGAAVVLDPLTGEILTMVGSKDYTATDSSGFKFNVVTQALRQPGSSIKPILYASALAEGYTASLELMDVDTKYPSGEAGKPDYNPKNYDGKFRGPIQMRYALANSINTIAVKTTALVGVREVLKTAYDMGLSTLEPTNDNLKRLGLSMALGGGEVHMLDLATAFGVFASGGNRMDPVAILKVVDAKGKTLYEYKPANPKQVLDPGVAYIMSSILSDNDARKEVFGLKSYLYIAGRTVAAKTGTTDDKRDNWTAGYTKHRVVIAWVGNNDNSPMSQTLASGVTGAAPIWNRIMREAIKDTPNEEFDKPGNVVELEIDAFGGGLIKDGYPTRKEFFIKGTEPTSTAAIYQSLKISRKDSNKLANAVEIATGDYDEKSFVVLHEDDPVSGDGKNRWQEGIDAWINSQGDSKFKPPRDTYQGSDQVVLSVKNPQDQSQINSNNVQVDAEAISNNDIDTIEIFVDGTKVQSRNNEKSISVSINVTNGIHTIKVKARDKKGTSTEKDIRVGINTPYVTPTP
jgi:1A family penicillin-binding protein